MSQSLFIAADEVAEILGVAKPTAYKIIRELNAELAAKKFHTIAGKVSRQYFSERFYGMKAAN